MLSAAGRAVYVWTSACLRNTGSWQADKGQLPAAAAPAVNPPVPQQADLVHALAPTAYSVLHVLYMHM
jgi:hypothetical protein